MNLPQGILARAPTMDDVPSITQLIAVCEEHDDGEAEIDADDVLQSFGRPGWDPTSDGVLVFDGDLLVGWADVYRGRAEADVRPSHRGRGLGAWLLSWTEARARALGHPEVGQTKTETDVGARQLFLSSGYRHAWESWILRIELDRPTPAPAIPDGIDVRTYDPATDEAAAHRMWEDAISPVRGREPEPLEVWASLTIRHAAFAPDLSRMAFDGDEPVGLLLAYDFAEASEVWIGQVATRASHRRRGIAGALLREAFAAARTLGRDRCGLSTDSVNGARPLYERNGMRVVGTYRRYAKDLT